MKDILLSNGTLVDPQSRRIHRGSIRIAGDRITEITEDLPAVDTAEVFDCSGKLVMPGLVDMHVHLEGGSAGYRMLARAGVTTALDMGSIPEKLLAGFHAANSGLTIGFLFPLIPGETVSGTAPSESELKRVFMKALSAGAFGIKIFGGHFPLAPDAMRTAIRLAYEEHCWIAVHAGSTRTPGNIEGFDELLALAENYPLHVAHINSYCRGSAERTPREDAQHALAALQKAPRCRSESYLANINGTSGRLDAAGIPCSAVTRRSLLTRGYAADRGGMEKAVRDGWARVHGYDPQKQEMVLLEPEAGWHVYCEKNSDVWVSFPVNDQLANILLAAAKDKTGKFIVDALATDGGEIPRNFTLRHGLRLVELDVMSLVELAHKASYAPAQLLGMTDRGYLAAGAAADVIVVNPSTAEVTLAIASGRIILRDGRLCGNIGQILTSSRGLATLRGQTIPCSTTNPSWRN